MRDASQGDRILVFHCYLEVVARLEVKLLPYRHGKDDLAFLREDGSHGRKILRHGTGLRNDKHSLAIAYKTVDHAAYQDDRWMVVALLIIGTVTIYFLTRYFMHQIAELHREIAAVRTKFATHLRSANADTGTIR